VTGDVAGTEALSTATKKKSAGFSLPSALHGVVAV